MKHCIDDEGNIYVVIPRFIAALKFIIHTDNICVVSGELFCKVYSFSSIFVSGECTVSLIGNIKSLTEEYSQSFKTLSDIKVYYDRYGKLPFGAKGLLKKRGWKVVPEKGYYMTIIDGNGNKIKLNKK